MLRYAAVLLLGCGCSKVPFVRFHVDDADSAPCVAWPTRELVYELDPALSARTPGDTERAAVAASVATWQAVADGCSDFHFTDGQGASKKNLIVWRETSCAAAVPATDPCFAAGNCDDVYGCWDNSSGSLAVTSLTYARATGSISSFNLQLNGADFLFTTVDSPPCAAGTEAVDCVARDVQNTVTHELGHVIGLAHVPYNGSTMSPSAPAGETSKRLVDEGTREGFCAIYPRGAPSPACATSP